MMSCVESIFDEFIMNEDRPCPMMMLMNAYSSMMNRDFSDDFSQMWTMYREKSFIEAGSYAAIAFNQMVDPNLPEVTPITDIQTWESSVELQAADILAGLLYGATDEFNLEGLHKCLDTEAFVSSVEDSWTLIKSQDGQK
jgi:hypothetical protein